MLGIYCRISREKEQGKDRSINDQKKSGIEMAKKLGVAYRIYIDEGVSGTLPIDKRPSFNELIDDIYKGDINSVFVYEQSRLERSPEVRFSLNRIFQENDVKVYTVNGLVTEDIESKAVGDIMSVVNNLYVELTKRKIKSVLRTNAEGGRAFAVNPFGYRTDDKGMLVVDDKEAEIVKEIFKMSLSGIGTDSIAIELKNREIPTRRGGSWSGKQVQDIIKNPIHKGQRRWQGETYKAPQILDSNYWDKVNANLKQNRNSGEKVLKHDYLLKGLCTCAKCGRNYYGRININNGDSYYMCSSKRKGQNNCGNRSIGINKLESLVWDSFIKSGELDKRLKEFRKMREDDNNVLAIGKKIDEKQREINSIDKERTNMLRLARKGAIESSDELFISEMRGLQNKKDILLSEVRRLEESREKLEIRQFVSNNDLKGDVDALSFLEKKELIEKHIQRIKILSIDKGAHYVGINVVGGYFPSIYHVAVRGQVTPMKIKFYRENSDIVKVLTDEVETGADVFQYFNKLDKAFKKKANG